MILQVDCTYARKGREGFYRIMLDPRQDWHPKWWAYNGTWHRNGGARGAIVWHLE